MAGSGFPRIELSDEQDQLRAVARALKEQSDGKLLRRELVKRLKMSAGPPIRAAQASIRAVPSQGLTEGQPLRATVAASLKPVVRLSGNQTGVSIRQTRTPGLRGFDMAGRRFNRPQFRHPVYGGAKWVVQQGKPEWFDQPMQDAKPEWKTDVELVVKNLAATIAERARAGQ